MHCKTLLTAAILLASATATANPADISWDYLAVGYAKASIKLDDERIKPDGWQVQGSVSLTDQLYLRGRFDRLTGNWNGINLKAEQSWLSLGLRQQVRLGLDAFFEGGYAKETASAGVVLIDDVALLIRESGNGYQLGAGFRYLATPELELGIALRHQNVSGIDSSTLAELNGRYRLSPQFDLYSNFLFDSDASILGVGVSFHF